MPIYEYECEKCGEHTEREYKVSEYKKRIVCPNCKSRKTHLVPTRTTFALKGGGWAETGYSVGKPVKKGVKP